MNRTGSDPHPDPIERKPNMQQMKVWWDQLGVKVTCKQIEHFLYTFSLHVKK